MPLPPCPLLLKQNPEWFILLVPAYPGCPGKKAIKRLCVCVTSTSTDNAITQPRHDTLKCMLFTEHEQQMVKLQSLNTDKLLWLMYTPSIVDFTPNRTPTGAACHPRQQAWISLHQWKSTLYIRLISWYFACFGLYFERSLNWCSKAALSYYSQCLYLEIVTGV